MRLYSKKHQARSKGDVPDDDCEDQYEYVDEEVNDARDGPRGKHELSNANSKNKFNISKVSFDQQSIDEN